MGYYSTSITESDKKELMLGGGKLKGNVVNAVVSYMFNHGEPINKGIKKGLVVELPDAIIERMDNFSKKNGITRAELLRKAIEFKKTPDNL